MYLAGKVVVVQDKDENNFVYKSAYLEERNIESDNLKSSNIEDNSTDFENITKKLEYILYGLGLFSSKRINEDDFTKQIYYDNMTCSRIIGANIVNFYYPYDIINYHEKNEYLMFCFNLLFQSHYKVIPFEFLDIPNIINIKRSNGSIQEAQIKADDGIICRQSKSDILKKNLINLKWNNQELFDWLKEFGEIELSEYIFINKINVEDFLKFTEIELNEICNDNNININIDKIYKKIQESQPTLFLKVNFDDNQKITEDSMLEYTKLIDFEEVFTYNPEIKSCKITFNTLENSIYSDIDKDDFKYILLKYYDNIFTNYIKQFIEPKIKKYEFKNIILDY